MTLQEASSCAALELQRGEGSRRPLVIDLYCGLGGWAEGFLEDYDVIGFDNMRHDYGTGGYPGQLVLQDATTLHGSQFKDAAVIVASPPCTEYSYMAMPWSRAKQIGRALRGKDEFPADYKGSRTVAELNTLFDTCFRLQREASEAAGRYIPLVVENVKGAQPWVGRARWHHGSFYLWGDVPALMPITLKAQKFNPDGLPVRREHGRRGSLNLQLRTTILSKNNGGSWFNQAHNTESGVGQNPDGRKLPENHDTFAKNGKPCNKLTDPRYGSEGSKVAGINWSGHGEPGYKAKGFNVTAAQRYREEQGTKDRDADGYEINHPQAFGWKAPRTTSKCDSRKAASAQIAKIPFPLARHIAEVYKP